MPKTLEHLEAEVAFLREKLARLEGLVESHKDQIHLIANRLNDIVLRDERDRLLREKKV